MRPTAIAPADWDAPLEVARGLAHVSRARFRDALIDRVSVRVGGAFRGEETPARWKRVRTALLNSGPEMTAALYDQVHPTAEAR